MNTPESSPLRALDAIYDRLASDPSYDLAKPGYSAQNISFCVVLNADGSLSAIQDERVTSGPRPLARLLTVPGQAKPSGSGLNPGFLWDNSSYLLGYKTPDKNAAKALKDSERAVRAFGAFRDRHLTLESTITDPGFAAVCAFLRNWTPDQAMDHKTQLDEFAITGFGVFRLVGEHAYIHDRPAVAAYWSATALVADPDATIGQCLITGETNQPLAQLIEPAIKSVSGALSGGAKIISFNCDAFTSYGKNQGLNSPISQSAAFRHATALNALLAGPQSRLHRVQVGDATAVFWTGLPTATESIFAAFLEGQTPDDETIAQDDTLRERLRTFFEVMRSGGGRALDQLNDDIGTPFYILGLSPNVSRLSVRFWHAGTVGKMVDHLSDHFEALRIVRPLGPHNPEFPAVWQLLRQTGRESKDISPLLAGPFLRAVLTGAPYPPTLASAVIARIRADREVSYLRAAILKAFLNRNHDQNIPMSLDPNRPEPAYRVGRLFAVLEKTQEDALPGINATIRDRFYSSASATPASVFPRLLRTYQHHLTKAAGERGVGLKVNRERLVQEICSGLVAMPAHLGLEGQSLFALGYYHQRQAFFAKADTQSDATLPAA